MGTPSAHGTLSDRWGIRSACHVAQQRTKPDIELCARINPADEGQNRPSFAGHPSTRIRLNHSSLTEIETCFGRRSTLRQLAFATQFSRTSERRDSTIRAPCFQRRCPLVGEPPRRIRSNSSGVIQRERVQNIRARRSERTDTRSRVRRRRMASHRPRNLALTFRRSTALAAWR